MANTSQSENRHKLLSSNVSYTQRNFVSGNGYIVTFKDKDNLIDELDTDQIHSVGLKWIDLCKDDNLSLLEIHDMVDNLYNDTSKDQHDTLSNVTMTEPDKCVDLNYITPCKTVRKEPRINFLEQNIISKSSQPGESYQQLYYPHIL